MRVQRGRAQPALIGGNLLTRLHRILGIQLIRGRVTGECGPGLPRYPGPGVSVPARLECAAGIGAP